MRRIFEFRKKLSASEILSPNDMLYLRGGDGEEDKRKELGGATGASAAASNGTSTSNSSTSTAGGN